MSWTTQKRPGTARGATLLRAIFDVEIAFRKYIPSPALHSRPRPTRAMHLLTKYATGEHMAPLADSHIVKGYQAGAGAGASLPSMTNSKIARFFATITIVSILEILTTEHHTGSTPERKAA